MSYGKCTHVHSRSTPPLALPTRRQPSSLVSLSPSLPTIHRFTRSNNNEHRQPSQRSFNPLLARPHRPTQPKHQFNPTTSTSHTCPYTNAPTATRLSSSLHAQHSNNEHTLATQTTCHSLSHTLHLNRSFDRSIVPASASSSSSS